jgi:chaperonin cofactor prefoldin
MNDLIREELEFLRYKVDTIRKKMLELEERTDQLSKIAHELQEFIFTCEDKFL